MEKYVLHFYGLRIITHIRLCSPIDVSNSLLVSFPQPEISISVINHGIHKKKRTPLSSRSNW